MEKLESPEQVTEVFLKAIHNNFGSDFTVEQMDTLRLGTGLFMTSLARVRVSSVTSTPDKILFQLEALDTIMRLTRSLYEMLQEMSEPPRPPKEGNDEKV